MNVLFPADQVAVLLVGVLTPLIAYIFNYGAPWVDEKIKAVVQVVVAAVGAGVYEAITSNVLGFNNITLQLVVTAIIGALAAHHWLWKPSGISTELGAGRNKT